MPNRYWPGRALPSGSMFVRLTPSLRTVCVVLASVATVGSSSQWAYAQFPPAARPPKTASEMPKGDTAAKSPPATLPSARSILDRHVAAIGGRAAFLSYKSTYQKGMLSMPAAGLTADIELFAARPNKLLMKSSVPGVGELIEAFDGTHAWSINPLTGPMLLDGKQLEEKRFDAEFQGELHEDGRYESMTTLELTDFDGRPCYKVRLVRKTGGEDIEFYEASTGLKAGNIATRETPMGAVTSTFTYSGYRKFGRLLQPTSIVLTALGSKQQITISVIEYDKVDPSVFEPPAGIKALIK